MAKTDPLSAESVAFLNGDRSGAPIVGEQARKTLLGDRLQNATMKHGTAIVASGNPSIAVSLGESYIGGHAVASLNEADSALVVLHAVISPTTGVLTITLSGNATADRTVAYIAFPPAS
jgi:hypothetical protein